MHNNVTLNHSIVYLYSPAPKSQAGYIDRLFFFYKNTVFHGELSIFFFPIFLLFFLFVAYIAYFVLSCSFFLSARI